MFAEASLARFGLVLLLVLAEAVARVGFPATASFLFVAANSTQDITQLSTTADERTPQRRLWDGAPPAPATASLPQIGQVELELGKDMKEIEHMLHRDPQGPPSDNWFPLGTASGHAGVFSTAGGVRDLPQPTARVAQPRPAAAGLKQASLRPNVGAASHSASMLQRSSPVVAPVPYADQLHRVETGLAKDVDELKALLGGRRASPVPVQAFHSTQQPSPTLAEQLGNKGGSQEQRPANLTERLRIHEQRVEKRLSDDFQRVVRWATSEEHPRLSRLEQRLEGFSTVVIVASGAMGQLSAPLAASLAFFARFLGWAKDTPTGRSLGRFEDSTVSKVMGQLPEELTMTSSQATTQPPSQAHQAFVMGIAIATVSSIVILFLLCCCCCGGKGRTMTTSEKVCLVLKWFCCPVYVPFLLLGYLCGSCFRTSINDHEDLKPEGMDELHEVWVMNEKDKGNVRAHDKLDELM